MDILVSCEYRNAEWSTLFETFKLMALGQSYFHIGDNAEVNEKFMNLALIYNYN